MHFKQYQRVVAIGMACLIMMTFSACQTNETSLGQNLTDGAGEISFKLMAFSEQVEAAQLINRSPLSASGPLSDANSIIANEKPKTHVQK